MIRSVLARLRAGFIYFVSAPFWESNSAADLDGEYVFYYGTCGDLQNPAISSECLVRYVRSNH